jgi:radical SAM superfamily enzyme YgiQ (UPF0313 family)
MGLYRMQNWLRGKHDVEVLDPNVLDPVGYFADHGPYDVIGFSPTKDNLHNDIYLIRLARKKFPQATIILGGVEATSNYQQLLSLTQADFAIMGEGEKALEYFLDENRSVCLSPSSIGHPYSYSTVLNAEEFTRATDLDFSLLPIREYWERNGAVTGEDLISRNCVNLYVTNYCPQGCKFCSTTRYIRSACPTGAKVVAIPPKELVRIIRKVTEQVPDTKTIYFHDDNACHYRDLTMEWCNLVIQEKINVSFVAGSRINHFSPEMLEVMKRAGFRKISIGVETYSDSLLKEIRKGQTTKSIDDFLNLTKSIDIPLNVNLILCLPEAKLDDVKRTAAFALSVTEKNPQNSITVHPHVKAYVGSWYWDNWDRIEFQYNTIPALEGGREETIRIPVRFMPRDPEVRKLLDYIDDNIEHSPVFQRMKTDSYLMSQMSAAICKLVLDYKP